jgi:hypothetical protein
MQQAIDLDQLRYPIGKFKWPDAFDAQQVAHWMNEIETTPQHMHKAVKALDDDQLDTPYRPDGWTIRQVVHHVADSHMNAYMRFKLTLTEDTPTVKPYSEALWAELPDSKSMEISSSLHLLENLHKRWDAVMRTMNDNEWQREFYHPEHKRNISLYKLAALYSWHGKHHVAHITTLRHSHGW